MRPGLPVQGWCRPRRAPSAYDAGMSRRQLVHAALESLRGCASARAVAARVAEQGGPPLSTRQVREALRQGDVTGLGGGYFALPHCADRPIAPWLRQRLTRLGPLAVDRVVEDVLARWPHGDGPAVRAWLHQDPPGVVVQAGVVRLPGQWGPPRES